jgi:hypothetical protein
MFSIFGKKSKSRTKSNNYQRRQRFGFVNAPGARPIFHSPRTMKPRKRSPKLYKTIRQSITMKNINQNSFVMPKSKSRRSMRKSRRPALYEL